MRSRPSPTGGLTASLDLARCGADFLFEARRKKENSSIFVEYYKSIADFGNSY